MNRLPEETLNTKTKDDFSTKLLKEAPQALESCYNGLNKMWGVVTIHRALRSESHPEGSSFIPETMKPDDALSTEEKTHARR